MTQKSGVQWIEYLGKLGISISFWAKRILNSPEFASTDAEAACLLACEVSCGQDPAKEASIVVPHRPIKDSNGDPRLLCIDCIDSKWWLCTTRATGNHESSIKKQPMSRGRRFFTGGEYVELENKEELDKMTSLLFGNGIPFEMIDKYIICIAENDKMFLENHGLVFKAVELPNLSTLLAEERREMFKKSREHYLATRDKAIDELLEKYGPRG